MLSLRDELLLARDRILTAYPTLQQDFIEKSACKKYSQYGDDYLGAECPSLVRRIADNRKKPKISEAVTPKMKGAYCENVYDADGNLLMINFRYINELSGKDSLETSLYVFDFDGYRYIFTLPPNSHYEKNYVCRTKYAGGKILTFEEYSLSYLSVGHYYSEIYFTEGGKDFCATERLGNICEENTCEWVQAEKYAEFQEDIKLLVSDKRSPVRAYVYELTFGNKRKLEKINQIRLYDGLIKTIYPPKPKVEKLSSELPATKTAIKILKQKLTENGYTARDGIRFSALWQTFKQFVRSDKFDCATDDILWDTSTGVNGMDVDIVRQFTHENSDGEYLYMEQLHIEFNIGTDKLAVGNAMGNMWSGNDVESFFAEVEKRNEFKAIPQDSTVKLIIWFGEV